MIDTQRWKERLYENSALRDDLGDEPAAVALEWAVKQIDTLQTNVTDENAFEDVYGTLERILRGVNRVVSHVRDYSNEQLRDRVAKVAEWAREIDLPVNDTAIDEWVVNAGQKDEVGRVRDLTQALAATVTAEAVANAATELAEPEAEVGENIPVLPEESAVPDTIVSAEVVNAGDQSATYDTTETADDVEDCDE